MLLSFFNKKIAFSGIIAFTWILYKSSYLKPFVNNELSNSLNRHTLFLVNSVLVAFKRNILIIFIPKLGIKIQLFNLFNKYISSKYKRTSPSPITFILLALP